MLNVFPHLLSYSFFGPTILRFGGALVLFYVAREYWGERSKIEKLSLPLIGHAPEWLLNISIAVLFFAAACLLVGYYTQAAAIVGIIVSLKHLIFMRQYRDILPLAGSGAMLLLFLCVSLLVTGAGALAFDLPL